MMRAVLFLVLLGLIGVGGYLFLTTSGGGANELDPVAVSEEAAASAESKLDRLQLDLEEIWLTDSELTSLFLFGDGIWDLGPVPSPVVRMRGDTLSLSGTVSPADLPDEAGLGELRRVLPDTVRVHLSGTVGTFSGADAIVNLTRVEVAGLPVPARFYTLLVERLGLPSREGVPESAFVLPLPRGVGAARVDNGVLVLAP
jgi:hypothetical protein